jgi:hypothetical protein
MSSPDGHPHPGIKPQLGKTNVGLYCEACDVFITLSISATPPGKSGINFTAREPQPFECPTCHHLQRREVSEIQEIRLTAATRRRV